MRGQHLLPKLEMAISHLLLHKWKNNKCYCAGFFGQIKEFQVDVFVRGSNIRVGAGRQIE